MSKFYTGVVVGMLISLVILLVLSVFDGQDTFPWWDSPLASLGSTW